MHLSIFICFAESYNASVREGSPCKENGARFGFLSVINAAVNHYAYAQRNIRVLLPISPFANMYKYM